ncbi:amino acid synthesis family protein [Nocardia sp. NPDC050630]|uniref:amino acid synthesis family protein n=1 Tax=Nocardia sp. NPDC050630 TaxID=3364321 RepID=UPI003799461D
MSSRVDGDLVRVRKRTLTMDTIFHEFGPPPERPIRLAAAAAVVANPFAGRYVEDLTGFMAALRPLGVSLAEDLVETLGGRDEIEAYGKASIVGVNGELEHGAVWHEAGGWAMRETLGGPKAIVPSTKVVAATGYRLMVPLHHVQAAYVRSHFNVMEIGVQDAPRPDEIVFALVMADGGRIHSRLGGLAQHDIAVHDGQR